MTQPQPTPVKQPPVIPVDFFRRAPGGGTVFVKPKEETGEQAHEMVDMESASVVVVRLPGE